jgi:hypothetical protein
MTSRPNRSERQGRRGKGWVLGLGLAILAVTSLTVADATPANARTPKPKKPSAPTDVQLRGINMAVTVSWSMPVSDGGSPITSFTATAGNKGSSCSTTATSCTITGLTEGHRYAIHVAASNALGTGKKARKGLSSRSATISILELTWLGQTSVSAILTALISWERI